MVITVKVKTRKKASTITQMSDCLYTASLMSAPTKNKANLELIDLAAKKFGVQRNQIKIKSGQYSQLKVLEISDQSSLKFE